MKNLKRAVAGVLAAVCLTTSGAVFADETDVAEYPYDGQFISDYVNEVVEYLSVFARDGINADWLYRAGLTEALKQRPELYEAVMSAILSSIDEHSVFYQSGEFEQFISQLEGVIGGIGITFNESGGNLVVGSVYEDTPAARSGIQPGDILYSADDNNLLGVSIATAQGYIRGELGTEVTIGVLREGYEEPLYFTMVREEIGEKQSVLYTVLSGVDEDDPELERNVMYIRIYSFMDNSGEQFGQAIAEADAQGITDIIIDVRDNGGGYISAAAEIANYFVPNGNVIVTEDHKVDLFDVVYKSDNERTVQNDVVVLVNGNSASASEILAAAIQENEVGVLIGTQTYGKGTVQSSVSLKDGEAMKFTSAYYLTPNENNIDQVGITPDAVVENSVVPFDYSGYSDFDYSNVYQRGMSDINVARAKKIFEVWGWYSGDVDDPYFDSQLELAVTQFQSSEGLFPYGVLDLTTQAALYKALTETTVEIDDQLTAAMSHFGIITD